MINKFTIALRAAATVAITVLGLSSSALLWAQVGVPQLTQVDEGRANIRLDGKLDEAIAAQKRLVSIESEIATFKKLNPLLPGPMGDRRAAGLKKQFPFSPLKQGKECFVPRTSENYDSRNPFLLHGLFRRNSFTLNRTIPWANCT